MNRLSSEVVSALRTDVTITSAPQCITELVLNSIDAGATSIAVRVDLNLYKLHVVDNGCGISGNDLSLLGHRYTTSKCHSLDDLRNNLSSFGFRGEALASLCEVAGTVMITSRPAGSHDTYCKIITQGRHQKVVPSSRPRPAQGTTILVADFLYNRPVRRSRVRAAFDVEEIKVHLEHIALIHPQVSLSLRDDAGGQIILETKKSDSIVDTFSSLFGPAIAETLCAVKESSKPFEISGYISKEAYFNKSLQFIYINKRLLLKSKLHKLINSIMGRSSILKVNNVPQNPISKEFNPAFFLAMLPPKRAKHGVYVLNITCPYNEYDITLDPKKTLIEFKNWDIILNCIEKLLRNFLEPQVTLDSPVKGSSLFDEIDRLAREDAIAKGVELDANLGIRTILGLPARRDIVVYTPPSQYTQESTIISSDNGKEDVTLRTCCSEDPFPRHLRGKPAPTISSEDPFPTRPARRNHGFDTASQEDSSTVSTKDFLAMFKQPVFQKKLKHPKPPTKLPVGGPLHFDLNFQRITNMMRPVEILDKEAERRKRSVFDSLQKFSMEKAVQLSPESNDATTYLTPVNAPVANETKSKESEESLADLPYASDLEARLGTPSLTPSSTPRIDPAGNTGIFLQENDETISENELLNQISNEQSSAEQDLVSHIDKTDLTAGVPQYDLSNSPSEDVIFNSQQENINKNSYEVEKQVFSTVKTFMDSEDFLVTRKDVENSSEHTSGLVPSDSEVSLPEIFEVNAKKKTSNALESTNSKSLIATESSSFQTESGSVCCAQREPRSKNLTKHSPDKSSRCFINHQGSSEELCHVNFRLSSSESEELFLNSRGKETDEVDSNINQINNSPIIDDDSSARVSDCLSKLASEVSPDQNIYSNSSTSLQEQCVKDNCVVNTRKRNTETLSRADEPLNKIVALEKSYFRSSETVGVDCDNFRATEDMLRQKSPEKSQNIQGRVDICSSGVSSANNITNRLKRHSVILNCSIDSLVAVLSPKQNRILKDFEKNKLNENNEALKSNLICKAEENTSKHAEITGLSRGVTGMYTDGDAVMERVRSEVVVGESSTQSLNTEEEIDASSSRNESLIAVNDRLTLENSDRTSESVSMEVVENGGSSAQFQNTGELGISSSHDESLIAVYDRVMIEKSHNSSEPVRSEVETRSGSSAQIENTGEFGISSSRDESLIADYDTVMPEKSNCILESVSSEKNSEISADFRNTGEFGMSSSRDESLVAVYDRTMLEIDRREGTSELIQSDFVTACGQEVNANLVGETENSTDGTDPLRKRLNGWEEHTDRMGRKFLIHSITGAIRSEQDHRESFDVEDRCRFVPKGLSPLVGTTIMSSLASHNLNSKPNDSNVSPNSRFENQTGLATAKCPNGEPDGVLNKSWPLLDQLLTTVEPEKEVPITSAMIQDQPHPQIKIYNVCYPYTFSKDIFNNLRVLGQLDRKFIVTIAKLSSPTEQSDVVVLFDQHAVHERIRVEQLTKDYRESGEGIVWRSAPVHPALPLSLSAREVRVMTNCSDKLRSLGLLFSKNDSHSVRITGVPTCLLLREDREVHGRGTSVLKSHLESLIREEVDALVQTRGAGIEQPAIIRNVIASEACRGAVKFGHILETNECQAYLHNLSNCDVPFQCAHGRPALTPIADLNHLRRHTKVQKLNLWKLRRT